MSKKGVPRPDMRGDKNPMRNSVIQKKQNESRRNNGKPWHSETTLKKLRKPKSEEGRTNIIKANRRHESRAKKSTALTGRIFSEEHKQALRRPVSEEALVNMRTAFKKRPKPSEETKAKMKAIHKRSDVKRRRYLSLMQRPNPTEKQLIELLDNICPGQFVYTGNDSYWIGYGKGRLNPDFLHLNKQKVIELFGWFHTEAKTQHSNEIEEQRKFDQYTKYGIQCLVIWDYELQDVETLKQKLLNFVRCHHFSLIR